MNKVSKRPTVQKGVVNLNDPKEEEFFKSVKPLVHGGRFFIAMDSGTHVEQSVYLNLDLLSIHIDSVNGSTCPEIINVKQLHKTELPPATLEQIRVYQRSPAEFSKVANLYEFNLHVLESSQPPNFNSNLSSQMSTLQEDVCSSLQVSPVKGSRQQQQQLQYRVKLAATSYQQLKEWIVGLNCLIKEKANLTRLATLVTGDE